jgi:tol-pal system protein YbgF
VYRRPAVADEAAMSRTITNSAAALLRALPVALLVFASMPAHALFEDDGARKAILELRARVDQLANDFEARLSRLEQVSQGQLQLQNQIDDMRQEIASLRGQIEVQANTLSKTQKQQRDLASSIDSRLKRFEPVQVTIDGKTETVDQAERRAFESALAMFRSGDFNAARGAFDAFLVQFPDSPYGPSASFWLGSSQFALKDYAAAIETHSALVSRHPENPRAPDAMLNQAYAQIESGKRTAGRQTLQTLLERYPSAPAAQAARDRLAALR